MNEYFWSLTIETGWVQAAIWTIEDKQSLASGAGSKAHVIKVSNAVHWEADEDLVTGVDTVLSSIVQELEEGVKEPSRTVFGVPPDWVSEGQIKKEYLEKIRNICQKLSLEPSGFVVLPEAIAHFKKSEENAPLSAVIIGVGTDTMDITVVRLGNIAGTVNVGRSLSVVDDVVEGIARFGGTEPFPSRFLIYDGRQAELEDVKQDLIKADWTGELKGKTKFLHTPQVEVIDPKMKMVAVSLAGASEIGQAKVVTFDVADEKGEENLEDSSKPKVEEKSPDIANAQDMGFVMDQDINKVSPQADQNLEQREVREVPRVRGNIIESIKSRIIRLPLLLRSKFKPSSRMNLEGSQGMNRRLPIILAIGFTVMLLFGFIVWWFTPRADVTIFVSPKKIESTQKVMYDPKLTAVNLSQRTLPVSTVSTTVSGDKTRSVTGTVTIGDKAKGTVDIRNGGSEDIGLSAGTVLAGPNSLNFTLDNSASVSAASSPSNPGTATVNVTANGIGAEYNLAKGETLAVGNFQKSQVDAIVDSDFSGGSSQEVVAVAKDDLTNLAVDLTTELTDKGKSQLLDKLGNDEVLIDTSITATPSSQSYDHQVGDQTSTLKLSENLTLSSLVVSKKNLNDLAREVTKSQVPSGFVIKDEQIGVSFGQKGDLTGGVWKFDTAFTINLLPQINTEDVAKKIAGKSQKAAQDILSKTPGFVRAEISESTKVPLPGFLSTLPHVVKNITVELSSEK